jgi:hypothetical protein
MDRHTMVQTQQKGRSLKKFSKERVRMIEDPTILARGFTILARDFVIVHRSSLERMDSVTKTTNIPREKEIDARVDMNTFAYLHKYDASMGHAPDRPKCSKQCPTTSHYIWQ